MSEPLKIIINQSCAILIDGNNIELSLQSLTGNPGALADFDKLIPKLLQNRGLSRLIYFREGRSISEKLAERLLNKFHGSVIPCHKSADIPLTIKATQIAQKVDTIIILSGDSDYVELVRHLRGEGVRVEIAAIRQTTAKILIDEADHFTPITEEDCYILKNYNAQNGQKSTQKSAAKTSSGSSSKTSQKTSPKAKEKTPAKRTAVKKTIEKPAGKKVPSSKTKESSKPRKTTTKKAPEQKTVSETKKNNTKRRTNSNKTADQKKTPEKPKTQKSPSADKSRAKTSRSTSNRKTSPQRRSRKRTSEKPNA